MIEVRNLYKSFGTLQVLKDVSLKVNEGETMVVMGKSGIGKSVLLKQIIGINKPDQGQIFVNEIETTNLYGEALYEANKDLGMLFQGGALFDSMSVFENVIFHESFHKNTPTESLREVAQRALEQVDLKDVLDKVPAELSGGMKKRVALARLIAYRPKMILYDEPTTGLDPITAQVIIDLIIKVNKELNATSIVVTHDLVLAIAVASKIALIDQGEVHIIEDPKAFFSHTDNDIINFFKKIMPHQCLTERFGS
jgi:phospholipid/cholesterol/gamma-HCH transport system ATP-binding protein